MGDLNFPIASCKVEPFEKAVENGWPRESNLLLPALSPAYPASTYYEWEIVEFLNYPYAYADF